MKFLFDILRGAVIGIANIIPGVSGGTMMVSMGIYDTLIYCITHIFKQFIKSLKILFPYLLGMLIGIGGGSIILSYAFDVYPLPTNTAFIGLILGGIPAIVKNLDKKKINKVAISICLVFFALIILLQYVKVQSGAVNHEIQPGLVTAIVMVFLGAIASATMVIPGVSGSMILVLLGYYDSILATISGFILALKNFDSALILHYLAILLPFGVGVLLGIFLIAKLIEYLLKEFFTYTYSGILGLVLASPIVVLMNVDYSTVNITHIIISIMTFAIGYFVAYMLSDKEGHEIIK